LSPFRHAANLQDEVDNIFNFAFGPLLGSRGVVNPDGQSFDWAPSVDLYEDKDAVTVQAELPGLKKEDITLNLEDGVLTISGERKQEKKFEEAESHRIERYHGRFQRVVSLPSEVDAEKIKAAYNDGILTVTLPKSEKVKPRQIPINVN
jgi:HSP20 family protein